MKRGAEETTNPVEWCLWILHHDSAPVHNALFVKKFLAGRQVTVHENAPYSLDLAPFDFFLFPNIKSALKGSRFGSMDEVKVKTAELLHSVTPNDLQHCFEQWKMRMQRCVDREGMYVEGDN